MNICIECKWCTESRLSAFRVKVCSYEIEKKINMVYGHDETDYPHCIDERTEEANCGPEGKFWECKHEPKPIKRGFFARLLGWIDGKKQPEV